MKKIISLLLISTIILTGCGTNNNNSNKTMSYEAPSGTVSYKENPKVYADYNVGEWLYVDANLVGADMTWPADSWTDVAKERNIPSISEDMEAIAALQPDLIYTIHEDFVDQYSAIAPTIYIPYGTYGPEELVVEFGKIVGNEKKANNYVKDLNKQIKELSNLIDNKDLTISIVDAWSGTPTMYGANFGRGGYILYNKLGLKGTDKAEQDYIRKENSYMQVDAESMIDYVGDVLFIVDNGQGSLEAVKNLPTYNQLKAVKEGNVFVIDQNVFSDSDPYSMLNQVKALKEIYSNEDL
ncbi:MAG: ABC transporter substrate-binding protein [Mycoplasmatales bacterium]